MDIIFVKNIKGGQMTLYCGCSPVQNSKSFNQLIYMTILPLIYAAYAPEL